MAVGAPGIAPARADARVPQRMAAFELEIAQTVIGPPLAYDTNVVFPGHPLGALGPNCTLGAMVSQVAEIADIREHENKGRRGAA